MITETLTVSRGSTDKMSKRTTDATHSVEGVFSWGRYRSDWDGRESAATTTELYVERGADVKARDRIARTNGEKYVVVGHPMWDQGQPQTGHDFGYMVVQLESANG